MKGLSPVLGWRRRRALAALAVVPLVACERLQDDPTFAATDITGVPWGRDFRLFDVSGAPRNLADYRGKVVMLFFGYTHCPDVCPLTLAKMAKAVRELGDDGTRVQGLFVTLDPARDTPQVLSRYVPAFHSSFVGLTAEPAVIDATAAEFKVFVERHKPDEHGAYPVDHAGGIYVFDTSGRLRLYARGDNLTEMLVRDLKVLL